MDNNKDIPREKTSSDHDNKKDKEEQSKNTNNVFPEIGVPGPSTATPSFPDEMPPREYK